MFKSFNYKSLLAVILSISFVSLMNTTEARARTTSVVTFNSEYGLILIDSMRSRAAFDLFESLNVPIKYGFFYQTKIFAPKDKSFRIACTAYGANHVCAVIVYPGKFATLDFDTDEIRLNLPATIARNYDGKFPKKQGSFHLETEDKRLIIDWSIEGLSIKNFRFKGDHQRPKRLENYTLTPLPGVDL
ncbi:MAG: hypothetical protein DHS20C08_23380 [Rhodomicrobium sp.]|nr:MAG: hypothetical protein DHS20C08_23380 [Rhodomicrobium sp.]